MGYHSLNHVQKKRKSFYRKLEALDEMVELGCTVDKVVVQGIKEGGLRMGEQGLSYASGLRRAACSKIAPHSTAKLSCLRNRFPLA